MSQKSKVPFWMISAMCASAATAGAFVYSEYFWPNGNPPQISGTWKLGSISVSGGDDALEMAKNASTNFGSTNFGSTATILMTQNGKNVEFYIPDSHPKFTVSGTLEPPDEVQFFVQTPKEISPSKYTKAEGKVHINGKQMCISGTYKTYLDKERTRLEEQGVWGGTRVDTVVPNRTGLNTAKDSPKDSM